jgi:streptomycin 6-kinase
VFVIPQVVRNKAVALGASAWLRELPSVVAGLARDWSMTVGRVYEDATEAFVASVELADGTPAVLKVLIPRSDGGADHELTVLRLAGGDGCVRVLRADDVRGALLLERLGRPLSALGLPLPERLSILCTAASALWRPCPPGTGLPTGAAKAAWLSRSIGPAWEALERPCSAAAVSYALSCAESRAAAHSDARSVLVHGDVHQWNTLEAPGGGFKLVDPDGLLAEPEYDLGVLMREDPAELLGGDPWDRARWLASRCDLSAEAIWEWGVVERVSTGLLGLRVGFGDVARQMLEVADRVADLHGP